MSKLLETADTLEDAKTTLLLLMELESRVLVVGTGASRTALDKLFKWARTHFFVTPAPPRGFVVYARRPVCALPSI